MFRLASCNELIRLREEDRDILYPEEHAWGLKQFGTLFCVEQLMRLCPQSVLEVGAGRNRFFDEKMGACFEYWMLDSPGFYDAKLFEMSHGLRKRTHFVEGMLGSPCNGLPESYFDVLFSISVLEHVPSDSFAQCCRHMYALLKSGGITIHTIDLNSLECQTRAQSIYDSFLEAGFELEGGNEVDWTFERTHPILVEPLPLVFNYYYKGDTSVWNADKAIYHSGCIAVIAKKPHN